MIQANELRIGNWVAFRPNKKIERYCRVISISEKQIVVIDKGLSLVADFEPIPLTPEILEKCGFEKKGSYYEKHGVKIGDANISGHHQEGRFYYFGLAIHLPQFEVKYLHELQNLYFALTREELNVSL